MIGGTLVVAALGAFLLVNSDRFQRTLEEVTLPLQHEDIIRQQAAEKDVPADLIAAVIYTESRVPGPDLVRGSPRTDADHARHRAA